MIKKLNIIAFMFLGTISNLNALYINGSGAKSFSYNAYYKTVSNSKVSYESGHTLQGPAKLSGYTLEISPEKTWQGIQITLPGGINPIWGSRPILCLSTQIFSDIPCQILVRYTTNAGVQTFAKYIENYTTTDRIIAPFPATINTRKNAISPSFELTDVNSTQPIILVVQQQNLGDSGKISFDGFSKNLINACCSTPKSLIETQTMQRKFENQQKIVPLHKAFIEARGNRDPYHEALEKLGYDLMYRYRNDFFISPAHKEEGEFSGNIAVVDFYTSNFTPDCVSIFPQKADDITLDRFLAQLPANATKTNAEELFTRWAIWCLSENTPIAIHSYFKTVSLNGTIGQKHGNPSVVLTKIKERQHSSLFEESDF